MRNLQITLAYDDLSRELATLLGARNATWCTFGCWASKTAGKFIRLENHLEVIESYIDRIATPFLARHARSHTHVYNAVRSVQLLVREAVRRAFRQVSASIAEGNRMVFAEIGVWFARMVESFRGHTIFDASALDRFVAGLEPGAVEDGGQGMLRTAFSAYYRAIFERAPKQKAELVLLANDLVGVQEQTRVQRHIASAMRLPIAPFLDGVIRDHLHLDAPGLLHSSMQGAVESLFRLVSATAEQVWHDLITKWVMRLYLPGLTLDLGADIPPLASGAMFPRELRSLENQELSQVLARLDRTRDTLMGTAARDWSDLDDRMNYIVNLFRSRQQDVTLRYRAFSAEQIAAIRRGRVPSGCL